MRRNPGRRLAAFVLAAALVLPAARAAVAAQVDPLPFAHDNSRLKTRIEERWRVIPVQGGLVLVPRRPTSLVKGVEICRDGMISIDGQMVTGADLQNRLGPDADAVLRLSYLSPDERALLFQSSTPATADSEPVERGGSAGRSAAAAGAAGATASSESAGSAGGSGRRSGTASSTAPWTEVLPIARGDRVRIGGDAYVDESEQVSNVTTVLGSANIDGVVSHDVVTIGGSVRLGPKAVVHGSITTVGGTMHAEPGARIDGQVSELTLDSANLRVWWPHKGENSSFNVGITPDWPQIARITFIGGLLTSALWLALCAGALVIAPKAIASARENIGRMPIGSFAAGLAVQLLFAPVAGLIIAVLAMSVIGIPLIAFVPLAMFALFVAMIFGSTALMMAVGERLVGRMAPMLALVIGGLLLFGVTLVGRYLWMQNQGGFGWGFAIACAGVAIEYVAVTIGFGGALLSWTRRLSLRRKATASLPYSSDAPAEPIAPLHF